MVNFSKVFCVLFFFFSACADIETTDILEQNRLIVGGQEEPDFPEIGAVRGEVEGGGNFICTGTLITPNIVVTAGHCIVNNNNFRFEITEFINGTQEIVASFIVEKAFAHPGFDINSFSGGNDIGVLILQEDVPASLATPMAFIEEIFDDTFLNKDFLAVGYGVTDRNAGDSGTKRSVVLSVSDINQKTFDYGNEEKNICNGDSGGPDIISINGVDTIIGVHSFSTATQDGPGLCRERSVSTRVDIHADAFLTAVLNGEDPTENGPCVSDGQCTVTCGNLDPDCECQSDGFCDEVCFNGVPVDPDCCGADATCNEDCDSNGISDVDCVSGGGCTIEPIRAQQNNSHSYSILISLFAMILFGMIVFRQNSFR